MIVHGLETDIHIELTINDRVYVRDHHGWKVRLIRSKRYKMGIEVIYRKLSPFTNKNMIAFLESRSPCTGRNQCGYIADIPQCAG